MTTRELIASGCIVIGCSLAAFLGGGYYASFEQEAVIAPADKEYVNEALGFAVEDAMGCLPEETAAAVNFKSPNPEDPYCFGIWVMPTDATTTHEWLEQQPRGGQNAAGYEPLLWLDEGPMAGARAFVLRYVVVDMDGTVPIYGKVIEGVAVANGKLYRLSYMNQLPHDAVPQLADTTLRLFSGFHVLSGQ